MPPRNFFDDTNPRALEVFLDLQRRMTPAQKLDRVFELSAMLLQLSMQRVRELYPEASEREVFLRTASRHIDRELMIRAYGWDPAAHDPARHQERS